MPAGMIHNLVGVLLCYVDESYTHDHYYLAALVCPDDQALSLTEALDAVVARAAASFEGLHPEMELHGYEMMQAKGQWSPLAKLTRARIGVYDQALSAIAAHQVRVFVQGIHPSSRLRNRHPHSLALAYLLEHLDEYAAGTEQRALVIADEPGQYDQQHEYRSDLDHYRSTGTGGYKPRKIRRIVDTLHFAPSRASRLVQASDLIAFLFHRLRTKPDGDARAVRVNQTLWSRLDGKATVHEWRP